VLNSYLTQIRMNLRLTLRNRMALFFSYIFPLIFFLVAAQTGGGSNGQQITNIVLGLGVLGSGLMGVGMRAVQDREQNILRRFKVAPIGPGEILVSGLVTILALQLPNIAFLIVLAHRLFGGPWPPQPISLFIFVSLGLLAFGSIGGIVAAIVNSMQEGGLLLQLFYFPMLFLGGITFPIAAMPVWLQTVAQFIPSTYFTSGLQPILRGKETLFDNLPSVGALALTTVLGTLIAVKLFRWEKEEKLRPGARLWLLAVLGPFFILGAWQMHAKTNVAKAKVLAREVQRNRTALIHDARLVLGDGTVVDQGSVLIKDGKIAEIYTGVAPDAKSLRADAIEAAGKTLLPGLIDVHVQLGLPGLPITDPAYYQNPDQNIDRELAAYLFSGVTAVKSVDDQPDMVSKHRATIASGERLGAELFAGDPSSSTTVVNGIERGVMRTDVPPMGVTYDPMLAAVEAMQALADGKTDLLDRSLVQQVVPRQWFAQAKTNINSAPHQATASFRLDLAKQNLAAAYRAGVTLVTGTDSGNLMVVHGPAVHRELQLWVDAGIPPAVALQDATYNAARLLGAGQRIGLIRKGYEASLLLVDGNPLQDISATERISTVFFKGERVDRTGLFEQK
jgi:ABC-type transport system involved in cytochrome c biogenesis permease component